MAGQNRRASARRAWSRRNAYQTISLCLALANLAVCAPSASARPHHRRAVNATVSWSLPRTATAGQPIGFSWSGRHLGPNHRLVIQKPEGTAHIWRTIMRLPSKQGSAELPGLPLGRYRLRLADLTPALRHRRHRRDTHLRVLARRVAGIGVFGQVPFTTLFKTSSGEAYGEGPGVYATPSATFPYVYWSGAGQPSSPSTAFSVEHNHCIAAHVDFVPSYPGPAAGDKSTITGTVSIIQESRDPIGAIAPYDAIGSVEAALVPGQSWSVNASYQGDFEPRIYLNGYAVCDSVEPFFS